ncbi:MAG: DUF4160 domain-containing protein [Candidatus Eisenbacteria bacterium]|nr:DUF4160 domain-containing protein [Candidatus Eisenbacteria bacterium]
MSPTILRLGPYRFFFYSNDAHEPPHVHVERDWQTAKFWLQPVRLATASGFSARELRGIESIVKRHSTDFREAWDEYFSE